MCESLNTASLLSVKSGKVTSSRAAKKGSLSESSHSPMVSVAFLALDLVSW